MSRLCDFILRHDYGYCNTQYFSSFQQKENIFIQFYKFLRLYLYLPYHEVMNLFYFTKLNKFFEDPRMITIVLFCKVSLLNLPFRDLEHRTLKRSDESVYGPCKQNKDLCNLWFFIVSQFVIDLSLKFVYLFVILSCQFFRFL